MCIIIYKPQGVNMPTTDFLYSAARINHDGFGFCTPDKLFKTISIDYFLQKIKVVKKSEPCLIHFRLATHGSIKQSNCHPFKRGDLKFCHNGILDIATDDDRTDSETAFEYMAPIIHEYGYGSPAMDRIVSELIGVSRFAFMQNNEVRLYGQWHAYNGLKLSNTYFL